tara:strand:- start:311 stop:487 length:177 start_codon:yes stop_codon:yes gene_type:complete
MFGQPKKSSSLKHYKIAFFLSLIWPVFLIVIPIGLIMWQLDTKVTQLSKFIEKKLLGE